MSVELQSFPVSFAPPFSTDVGGSPPQPKVNTGVEGSNPVNSTNSSTIQDEGMEMLMKPYSTLDEPVRETIMRDVRSVMLKLKVVMLPLDRQSTLGQLEYIGIKSSSTMVSDTPNAFNNTVGDNEFTIDGGDNENDIAEDESNMVGDNQKAIIRSLREWDLWGPLIICLALSVLLSLESTVEQASAVFATVFMLVWVGASIVTVNAQFLGGSISFFQSLCVLGYSVFPMMISALLIAVFRHTPLRYFWLDCIWVLLGFIWATRASTVFIGQYIVKERRALAVFPVFFFYIFLSWMILLI